MLGMRSLARPLAATTAACPAVGQVRHLNVHEYQGHQVMKQYGVVCPPGKPAHSLKDAISIAKSIIDKHGKVVVKSQIHAGGRGMGTVVLQDAGKHDGLEVLEGGVHMCDSLERVEFVSKRILGNLLVTKQTGPAGKTVSTIYMAEPISGIVAEKYFAILMDRATQGPMLVGSPAGGMAIEDVAEANPEKIFKCAVDINVGVTDEQALEMAKNLEFTESAQHKAAIQIKNLYDLFVGTDATQVEINPLIENEAGAAMCLDAKLNFDDNAKFRQGEVFDMRDPTQEDPREVAASEFDINYIGLDGNIACMVNGAGLAMATMDIIKLYGGEPANFLDLGGGASTRQVTEALKLIQSDPNVDAVLVNIFGGIMRCDVIAAGIVQAAKTVGLSKPLIVRLEGTNVEQGNAIINEAHSEIHAIGAEDLDDAAKKACDIARIKRLADQSHLKVSFEIPL
jgi:succinyl-CoA synthetase beta subunit